LGFHYTVCGIGDCHAYREAARCDARESSRGSEISALNDQNLHDRTIRVDLARPRETRRGSERLPATKREDGETHAAQGAPSVEQVANPAADRSAQSSERQPSEQSRKESLQE